MPEYKNPTPTPGPIHDGYKYPMVETKPVPRESLYQRVKKAVMGTAKMGSTQGAKALADRKAQERELHKEGY